METEDMFVERLAKRYSLSSAAVQAALVALRRGGGRMAQFSHADFGGMSQWSPGMSMVGDMFNTQLKSKLDGLCTDIVAHLTASEVVGGDVSSKAGRGELPVGGVVGGLVAARVGAPGSGGWTERPPIRSFPRNPSPGHRRSGHDFDLRYRRSSDLRGGPGSKQRADAFLHISKRLGEGDRPHQGLELAGALYPSLQRNTDLKSGASEARLFN